MPLLTIAKMLVAGGLMLLVLGGVLYLVARSGFTGLPGDIALRRGNFSFYFPIVTSIVLSIVLTVVLNFFARFLR